MSKKYHRRNALVLAWCAIILGAGLPAAFAQMAAATLPPLTGEQVVRKLEENNRQRAAALDQFRGRRIYRMEYRGLLGDHDAAMTVDMTYQSPATKKFTVVSQSGSKFIVDHVFKKLLEGEEEALASENRERTALNTSNYGFTLEGYDVSGPRAAYVFSVTPKSRNKFLYRGKIWIDGQDFAVTRIEAEPAKSPSYWIKKSTIQHTFVKVNDFWLPSENRTESLIRMGGRALLSIEYRDYQIVPFFSRVAQDRDERRSDELSALRRSASEACARCLPLLPARRP